MPDSRLIDGQFVVGDPCWFDLNTGDTAQATEFYSRVFGWKFEQAETRAGTAGDEAAIAPEGYLFATIGERKVAGIGRLADAGDRQSAWLVHFAAPSLDSMVERVAEYGGRAGEPIDVAGLARRTIARDPSGAEFGLWDPSTLRSPALTETPGTVHWTELQAEEPMSVARFYEQLFDLEAVAVESKKGEGTRRALNLQRTELGQPRMVAGIKSLGGNGADGTHGASEPHWRLYFLVDSVEQTTGVAEELGGSVVMNQLDASERRVSVLTDPQGAEFAVVQRGTGSRDG